MIDAGRGASAAQEAPGPPASPRRALGRGFWDPHPLLLVAALGVAALGLLGAQQLVVDGAYTAVPESRFLRTPRDDWGHISWQVGRLKRESPSHTPVYLLGGSNVRECIESAASLEGAIRETCRVETEVHDLGSTNQHFGESLAIVENLPPTEGVVLIGINQTRFQYTPAEVEPQLRGRELLLRSPALRSFMIDEAGRGRRELTILPGIMNYGAGWVREHQSTLARGRLPDSEYETHRYHQGEIWSPELKRSKVKQWATTKGKPGGPFDSNVDFNAALLRDMVRLTRERGLTPVLFEVPENREIVGEGFTRHKQVYQPICRALAADEGAYYLDFVDAAELVNEDFRDLTHLVESGRAKWTPSLAAALCPVLEKLDAEGDRP